MLATAGALTTVEKIKAKAAITRAALNQEMGGLASMLEGVELSFTSKAGETGKLYGSITTQMIADSLNEKVGSQIDRHLYREAMQAELKGTPNLTLMAGTAERLILEGNRVVGVVTGDGETVRPASSAGKSLLPAAGAGA